MINKNNKNTSLYCYQGFINRKDHEDKNKHRGIILWFTGLSGSGKSTIAHAVEKKLFDMNCQVITLDGDNIRTGLCKDLAFTDNDRSENIRRIGEVAKLFLSIGFITITAFISPFRSDRAFVKNLVADSDFLEIFCNASLQSCEKRDVKGIYKSARKGLVSKFTGISSAYEVPEKPDLTLDITNLSVNDCVNELIMLLANRGIISLNTNTDFK